MKLLSLFTLLVSAQMALASSTEFLFQAEGGQNIVQAGYDYSSNGQENSSLINEDSNIDLSYEYGLSDMFSLGLKLDYSMENTNVASSIRRQGLKTIALNFKGNAGLGFAKLYYGLGFIMGPEAMNLENDNTSIGNQTIPAFVALAMGNDHLNYGLKLHFRYNILESIKESAAGDIETEEGHIFTPSVFVESTLSDKSVVGFAVNYLVTGNSKVKSSNVETEHADIFRFNLYGRVTSSNWSFLPHYTYSLWDEKNNVSTGGSYAIKMSVRKSF